MASGAAPGVADLEAAAARLTGRAHRTPVMRSRLIDESLGASLFFKCENFQRAGAFKFRGAFNALACLSPQARSRGVVAYSSGNHAQAVALAAGMFGVGSTLVMPGDTPASKLAATRAYGGRIVLYDRHRDDRREIAERLARAEDTALIPPFDHADVIAGQGTAAMELFEEAGALDSLFVCLGGGGLLAGSLLAAEALAPRCRVYGVEPAAGDDGQRSFEAGRIVSIEVPRTIADGAQTQSLGRITFDIIRRRAAGVVTVTDEQLIESMRLFAERLKIVVEPTGCLSLAGARHGAAGLAGQRVGVIVSGGNVDAARYAALLAAAVPALASA